MCNSPRPLPIVLLMCSLIVARPAFSTETQDDDAPPGEGVVVKSLLDPGQESHNLLADEGWRAFEHGFEREGTVFVCDNGADATQRRGLSQTIELNQSTPAPIVASAWSKADGVTGSSDSNYALYLDLLYTDGTPLWGQTAPFAVGSHDWQRRQVVIVPDRPVRSVTVNLLLRGHGGKAWFRDPTLNVIQAPAGACLFDGLPVRLSGRTVAGFQVRDVGADSDFVRMERESLGLELRVEAREAPPVSFFDVVLRDLTGRDRAITLVYAVPVPPDGQRWLVDPRRAVAVEAPRDYQHVSRFRVGSGRLSRYPFGAVAGPRRGLALGIDPERPAFCRSGYNAKSGELYLAWDLGLAPEKPQARLRFCQFPFDGRGQFRAAVDQYYRIFPEAFRNRTPAQGLWMPFAKISEVKGWQDFGFRFKEGNNETRWDDEHDILTFRYTEPMTWWMSMPRGMPRTIEAARVEARRLAEEKQLESARALLTSGFHDEDGKMPARLLDTPWCNGAVWSMNAMPGVSGQTTEFGMKWNPRIRDQYYGPERRGDLDGEYVDSSEGYVTNELDFRREHFASADTPLCFAPDSGRVAIFRGLIAFEYVRALARDVHGMDKLMMANSTPSRLWWLAPQLDVLGTETDWHRSGRWQPMSDADLLYRRVLCKDKPFCFLMNTRFEDFSAELVEKYMKRALAYGMFPGFFSHNASQGHYFTRPELYERDRPLFKKYVPLCKRVAEAGWEPLTRARSDAPHVYVERFGRQFLTVFNDSDQRRNVTIQLERPAQVSSRELVTGREVMWTDGKTELTLDAEDVAVLEFD